MILIPEIETVVILVPRTGTGWLRQAIRARYPRAMQIYRHMEADGVPQGYDRWAKVGLIREPVDRLWSLYKFLGSFGGPQHDPAFVQAMRDSVSMPFSQWLVHNEVVFTSPYDRAGLNRFFPAFAVRHPLPENRKSQFIYLRPDLGTSVYPYDEPEAFLERLQLHIDDAVQVNSTPRTPRPPLSTEAQAYVDLWLSWDLVTASKAARRAEAFA